MRILFVRHGQTAANVDGVLDTAAPGPGLTDLGHDQAAAIVEALGPGSAHEAIEGIYVSHLRRTLETAAPLAAAIALPPIQHAGLHEIEAGDLEGRNDHPAAREYLGTVFAWTTGDLARQMPGAGDGHAFFARFDAAIADIVATHGAHATVVVVSHAAAIRIWTGVRVAGLGDGFTATNQLDNTGVVVIEGSIGSWRALSWAGIPLGGPELADSGADDITGEPLDRALADAD